MTKPNVAVAIPAFNEADGIAGFLAEIDNALAPHVDSLQLIVVDDASTDGTRAALEEIGHELSGTVEVISNDTNNGHGASLMSAYGHALAAEPDFVLQVDGDGQFHGSDLRRVLVLLLDNADAVSGVRRFRQDPWLRMIMTTIVRQYMSRSFNVRARDANCPLRGYRAELLADLLEVLPDPCLIPNLYLTVLASHRGVAQLEVDVSHRVRRGGRPQGSTWERGWRSPATWRLLHFSLRAFRESRSFRSRMDQPVWARGGISRDRSTLP